MPHALAPVAAPVAANLPAAVIRATNAARRDRGRPTLRVGPKLMRAARARARRQARQGFLSHTDWAAALRRVGVDLGRRAAAENLAEGFTGAGDAVDAWLSSAGHRRNLLDADYRFVGVGVAFDRAGRAYIAQLFAS